MKKFIPLSETIFSSICRQDYKFFVYTHRVYLYIHMCKPQWLTVQSVNISQQYFHLCHNTPWKQRMQMSKYESSKTHTLTYFNRNWTKIWHLSTHLYICISIPITTQTVLYIYIYIYSFVWFRVLMYHINSKLTILNAQK